MTGSRTCSSSNLSSKSRHGDLLFIPGYGSAAKALAGRHSLRCSGVHARVWVWGGQAAGARVWNADGQEPAPTAQRWDGGLAEVGGRLQVAPHMPGSVAAVWHRQTKIAAYLKWPEAFYCVSAKRPAGEDQAARLVSTGLRRWRRPGPQVPGWAAVSAHHRHSGSTSAPLSSFAGFHFLTF